MLCWITFVNYSLLYYFRFILNKKNSLSTLPVKFRCIVKIIVRTIFEHFKDYFRTIIKSIEQKNSTSIKILKILFRFTWNEIEVFLYNFLKCLIDIVYLNLSNIFLELFFELFFIELLFKIPHYRIFFFISLFCFVF